MKMNKKVFITLCFALLTFFCIQSSEASAFPTDPGRQKKIDFFQGSLGEITAASQNVELTLTENNGMYSCTAEGAEGYFFFQLMRTDSNFEDNYELVLHSESASNEFTFDVVAAGEYTVSVWVTEDESGTNTIAFSQKSFSVTGLSTVQDRISEILADCIGTTDYDKAVWLHDWLTHNAKYDSSYSYYGSDGVLFRHTGVCDSYSKAYYLLLKAAGLNCVYAAGGGHSWNAVKLNGEWCWVDVTWDDPTGVDEIISGSEHHFYFGLPDQIMYEDHALETIEEPAEIQELVCATYENNYYIRTGILLDSWSRDFVSQANEALSAGETEFTMDCPEYYETESTDGSLSAGQEHIVYNITAYALGKMDLQGRKTYYVYSNNKMNATVVPSIGFSVTSVWMDGTTSITPDEETTAIVYLKRNDVETGDVLFLSNENNWSGSTYMEYVENAQYGVSRVVVDGYLVSTSTDVIDDNLECTITFRKKASQTQSLTVLGRFVEEDGETEFLPDADIEIPFRIISNDTVIYSSTLKGSGNWKVTISGLPANAVYSVEEDVPDGFAMVSIRTVDGTTTDKVTTITNRKVSTSETISIPVTAYWHNADGSVADDLPVNNLNVYLTDENDARTGDMLVLQAPYWTGTFTNLDKTSYGVTVDPQTGFNSTISAVDVNDITKGYTISLTRNSENPDGSISIPVFIEWDGEEPAISVDVYLLKDGERTGDVVSINAENDWTGAFENITVSEGSIYFIEEDIPAGYTMISRGAVTDGKVADGFRIVNKKKADSSNSSRLVTASENGTVTLRVNTEETCQWQYSTDDGKSWQNCIGESAATNTYVFSMQNSLNGRKYRCQVGGGYTGTFIAICIRSDDPFVEDVLYLPDDLTEIKSEGFAAVSAYTVVIPESVIEIGSRAFANCSEMRYVQFQGNDCEISDDSFEGTHVIFLCQEGSAAEEYAIEHDIPYLME